MWLMNSKKKDKFSSYKLISFIQSLNKTMVWVGFVEDYNIQTESQVD